MKRFVGIIPGLQRVAFYGIVALLISFFVYDLSFSSVVGCAFNPASFTEIFYAYMFWSIILYPVVTIIYALCKKYFGVGSAILHYEDWNILALVVNDIVGNIISPFIFVGMIFDSVVKKQKVFGVADITDLILLVLNVLYLVVSFLIVF
ncbi:MAG: hypothetical protein E7429_07045 [Ruminococcaceae bacterium]|nr:hypothetical protein [Oscillospiraceae bacterium]